MMNYLLSCLYCLMYGKKHNYVCASENLYGRHWPIHVCSNCNDTLYLDEFQIVTLPPSMAYGCEGKHAKLHKDAST